MKCQLLLEGEFLYDNLTNGGKLPKVSVTIQFILYYTSHLHPLSENVVLLTVLSSDIAAENINISD